MEAETSARAREARDCEKCSDTGMLPQQGWAWREGDRGYYWCDCPAGQARKAKDKQDDAREAATARAPAQRLVASEAFDAGVEYGEQRGARQERERIVEVIAENGAFDWWMRLAHLDRRHGTTEARDAIREFIEREFAAPPEREEP